MIFGILYIHIYIYIFFLSGILSDVNTGILFDVLSDILSGVLSGILSDLLPGIQCHLLSGIGHRVRVRWSPKRAAELTIAHRAGELAKEWLRGGGEEAGKQAGNHVAVCGW